MALKLTTPTSSPISPMLPNKPLAELAKPLVSSPIPEATVLEQSSRSAKERWSDINKVREALNKDWSITQSLVRLGSRVNVPIPSIETGIYTLDNDVFGCGGAPRGRIIEVLGPESSGKTTATLAIIAAAQAKGEIAAFIDVEHALDPTYANKLGVDVDNLLVSQPDFGEQALGIAEALVRSGLVSVIVIDSVAALVPRAELEGDMGDSHMGLQARLMSQALRKLTAIVAKSGTCLIFINQIREKIGVMYGSPETTTGGRALKFYASVRLDIRRLPGGIKDGDKIIGHQMKVKAVKNKVAVPFRETILDLYYPGASDMVGFDKMGDLVVYAEKQGIVEKAGAWYSFNGERLGCGLDKAKETVRISPEFQEAIIKALKEKK